MKKLLLSCLLGMGIVANAQFSENFDASTTMPSGWTVLNGGGANTFIVSAGSPGSASSSPNAAQINYNATAHNDYLVTPSITVTAGLNDRLTYFVKNQDPSYVEDYAVKISTTTPTAAAFTIIAKANAGAPNEWTPEVIDLSPYVGQTIYVGFHATSMDKFRLLFDDIVNDTAPTVSPNCPTLSAPVNNSTDIDFGATTLTWTASSTGGPVAYYELYMDTTTDVETKIGNYTTPTATFMSANNTSLMPSTKYYWRVVAVNSAGSSIGCTEVFSFTTKAASGCTTASNGLYGSLNPVNCTGSVAVSRTSAYASEYSTVSVVAGNTYRFEIVGKTGYNVTIATDAASPVVLAHGIQTVTYSPTTTGTVRFYSHVNVDCSGAGDSTTNHTRSVTCITLAVSDINKEVVSVYPNPFTDVLRISDVKNVKSIIISDASGRQVKTVAPASEINLGDLKTGLYIISLKMEDGTVTTTKAIKK